MALNCTQQELLHLHQFYEIGVSFVGEEISKYRKFNGQHAYGAIDTLQVNAGTALEQLQAFINKHEGKHIFGCLSYDLKNEIEPGLQSNNFTKLNTPDVLFFVPEIVVTCKTANHFELEVEQPELKEQFEEKLAKLRSKPQTTISEQASIKLTPRITKEEYFEHFETIQQHIKYGNFYEMNYCQEFYQEDININPYTTFETICKKAKAPFMTFLHNGDTFLLSGSPERYIQKTGNKIISQPIKGTAKRGATPEQDAENSHYLKNSLKELTENVMIVDLVRNDFSRLATRGSVKVAELQKVYTYPTVHQLISTVEANLKENTSFTDILRATYPMGSMTGAPKLKVMEVTEEVEQFKRGWYSGTVGYIAPNGDFDFNVVIRSIIYDQSQNYISYGVGGGITMKATAEEEYEECLLKVNSLIRLIIDS